MPSIRYGSWDTSSHEAEDKSIFIVEEYVEGGTLEDLVSRQMVSSTKLYRLRDAVRWLAEIAQALKYMHNSEPTVIHRDLKLANILLTGR